MKYKIKINQLTTVEEVNEYWSEEDHIALLEKMDFPDAKKAKKENLKELLLMAITDFEPNEAAAIILEYKLSDELNEGQIQQISNDMLLDKIAEEYPEIGLHATLFHINQLLYKAFNGKFPNTKASIIDCVIQPVAGSIQEDINKETALKLLSHGLSESNLIKRLFGEKLDSNTPFEEAEAIVWNLKELKKDHFEMLTSTYWIGKEDFIAEQFEAELEEEETD
ncbi:MAG: hypothetical protein WD431_15425 [Cyclobacteriaceae bacterium]